MKKAFRLSLGRRTILEGYAFVSLWVIGFATFVAYPFIESIIFSFQDLKLTSGKLESAYVGWKHFRHAFTVDVQLLPILQSTIMKMVLQVPLILIFSMFAAILLNRPMKGRIVFRGIFFLPVIIAAGETLSTLTRQGAATLPIFSQAGLVDTLRDYIPEQLVWPLLAMMDSLTLVMWSAGVPIIILLAGLQTISPALYEAAKCDGATAWESFWKITFPMLMPMLFISTLFSIVDSFTSVTNQMMKYIYRLIFEQFAFAYGSAVGWIYSICIFIIIAIVFFIFRKTSALSLERR